MASCLGISVGKNLIKYAKMSKDKASNSFKIEAYGVKFYDILSQTIQEIIQETKSSDSAISVAITSDDYDKTEVYKNLKAKDREAFLQSEFEDLCAKKGKSASSLDAVFLLTDSPESMDQYKVLCAEASKVELSNLWQALSTTKFEGITAIGSTITNLLQDKGAGQNCLIVNIEDNTKLTIIKNGSPYEIINIPIGMDEVISSLAEKYNSYAKAYEACKGVDAYADVDVLGADSDGQSVREILMPTLYELKQRIMIELQPYYGEFGDVYITGTGIIVNNIDLYLSEAFPGKRVEMLVPFFVNKERNSLKDVLEVNSALAASTICLNGIKKEEDFLASGSLLKKEVSKKNASPKVLLAKFNEKINEINQKTLKAKKTGKKKKKNIQVDGGVESLGQLGGSGEYAPSFEEEVEYYDPIAEWLTRLAIALFAAWVVYTAFAHVLESSILSKTQEVNNNIAKTEQAIKYVQDDKKTIDIQARAYDDKKSKLQQIIQTVRLRREATYQVPNFLSQLMFIIPTDVKVTAITVGDNNAIRVEAESPKYAQLGYFVSRLKLAGIIKDVDMEVKEMSSDIKIIVKGVLP
ncbi:MAG: hypothetical protein IKR04_03040 [Clostridia bacterium]|nr:hypothetical protein [Clostridia bacterium]